MDSFKPLKVTMLVVGLIVIVVFTLCTSRLAYNFQVLNGTKIELQSISQISQDWSILPYTHITLRTGSCAANEEPVFGVNWKGTTLGCD